MVAENVGVYNWFKGFANSALLAVNPNFGTAIAFEN
jgi:hypothetical protein